MTRVVSAAAPKDERRLAGETFSAPAATPVGKGAVRPFPMTEVRLLPGYWRETMERTRMFLYSLPNDRLAHNFRVTAGLTSDAEPLGGWEAPDCELRGHYVGHYLSACALLHASTGDEAIAAKANELVGMLAECQAKDGYLGAYPTELYDRLRTYKPVWAPFYTYHKILTGLIDMHQYCGNAQALGMATRMADWADAYSRSIPDDAWQRVLLVEQGGMNEASFNLYAITGDAKYRELGYRFEHKKMFDPLAAGEDQLAGNHANTNIPKMIGAARGYELTGDERYAAISQNFYKIVTEHHIYCTGGTSDGEMWHEPDAIASKLGASAEECCCSYNMMKLTRHLYARRPDAKYFDYYERLLLNVRYGTQDKSGMLMYYVSLKPGLYKTFGTPADSFWCCTGTGSEEYAKLNDSIYFHDDDAVYVNLFIASTLDWKERGLVLKQETKYPEDARCTLTVVRAPLKATALKIRVPYWVGSQGLGLTVNGMAVSASADAAGYVRLARDWKAGDAVSFELPMTLHVAPAPDDKQVQAAMYGPLVLAARLGTEDLTTSMIYGQMGPFADGDEGYPMPVVDTRVKDAIAPAGGVWFEKVEGSKRYPLQFRTLGHGPRHELVPLNQVMEERYSVYLRNLSA